MSLSFIMPVGFADILRQAAHQSCNLIDKKSRYSFAVNLFHVFSKCDFHLFVKTILNRSNFEPLPTRFEIFISVNYASLKFLDRLGNFSPSLGKLTNSSNQNVFKETRKNSGENITCLLKS